MNNYDASVAARYSLDNEHVLPDEEVALWWAEMTSYCGGAPTGRLLDVGAGTGALVAAMKSRGLVAIGLEPSTAMIAQGKKDYPSLTNQDFIIGDAEECSEITHKMFDWVISRQVLCHLAHPQQAMRNWHSCLRPGGLMMLVDGFWSASSWKEQQLRRHPFASLETPAPVAEAAENAGFSVLFHGSFDALNELRRSFYPEAKPRYLVVAVRS